MLEKCDDGVARVGSEPRQRRLTPAADVPIIQSLAQSLAE